jgi:peptide/nickel transport system ATP-binding protein
MTDLAGSAASTATTTTPAREPLLKVEGLTKHFPVRSGLWGGSTVVRAVEDVNFEVKPGETLGLVGESGSGKSTLAKTLLGIHPPDAGGQVEIEGNKVAGSTGNRSSDERRAVQMIFQNPDSALNRNWTVRRILKRSVKKLTGVKGAEADRRVDQLAESLRLSQRHLDLKPRQLSGGLKQRVAIARAFAGDPRIVVCD